MNAIMNNKQFTDLFTCESRNDTNKEACHIEHSRNADTQSVSYPSTKLRMTPQGVVPAAYNPACHIEHSRNADTQSVFYPSTKLRMTPQGANNESRNLLNLLETMSDKAGARFLIELITHPNQPIHVSELRHLHSLPLLDAQQYRPQYSRPSLDGGPNPFKENSIPYCDKKTLDDVKNRLKKLQIIKHEAKCCNDYARLDDIYTEEEFLIDYLKKAINRKGEPRYLRDTLRNDYSYVKKSISRIIDRMESLDPFFAKKIREHLVTGLRFKWKD